MSKKPSRLDDLEMPLLTFSHCDAQTLQQACEATWCFGETGSKKSLMVQTANADDPADGDEEEPALTPGETP